MFVHWHPDNVIYVRNEDWSIVCSASKEQIEDLLSVSLSLPENMIERWYFPNNYTSDFDGKTQYSGPSSWEHGDMILDSISEIIALSAPVEPSEE